MTAPVVYDDPIAEYTAGAALLDGQYEIGEVLTIGCDTAYRLPYDQIQWFVAPEVRTSDMARYSSMGYVAGRDLLGTHTTTLQVLIVAPDEATLGSLIDDWKSACRSVSDGVVAVRSNLFGNTRVRFGRFRIPGEVTIDYVSRVLDSITVDPDCAVRAMGSAQFVSVDPRTYGDTLHTVSTSRTVAGTGFVPPFVPPFTLGVSTGGSMTVTNAGNQSAPWVGTLTGPLTWPEITHVESGRRLAMDLSANGGLDLAAGEWVTIESDSRAVFANGVRTADRRDRLTLDSSWWDLQVGTNTFELNADSGAGTLSVAWRDCWLS